ncbi:hypothetical protein EV200_10292 [Pedobacter psychrotolerans]|uniref:Lipoprotein n=1 Tax=Pedobacter psychrotolerans TaxID=1843235 RepID=A0A4R2HLP5_9SPHI|nr:hypothetical protein [Pedobacter psychrotolerans]TCO28675.1 hypothetical protein EV200_10292 [Pedobacter psychrotolerans]GGE50873.1 hypothetical protein GCM10011413_16480 [Pedobacter psychrotolerans]
MRNIIPILAIFTSAMMACQSNNTKTTSTDSKVAETDTNLKQCFQYINKKDTASLNLVTNKGTVNGVLSYNLFEKDKNNGSVAGIVKGDTIIADYTFQSEGTTSTRQVVWLKKNDQLIEGFGDVEEVKGKMKFKNTSSLRFDQSIVFKRFICN